MPDTKAEVEAAVASIAPLGAAILAKAEAARKARKDKK